MTTRTRVGVAAAFSLVILAGPSSVRANSGLEKRWPAANGDLETVGQELLVVHAGQNLELRIGEATNPAAYPYVVLDVFDYPSGSLNSEGASTGPNPGDNATVIVAAEPSKDTQVTVIVRNKYATPPRSQSNVPLSASKDGGSTWVNVGQYSITGQPRIFPDGGLKRGTVVTTVQEPDGVGGATDTMLLVLEDDSAVSFDDDMGIQRMSRTTLAQACGGGGRTCSILAARRSNDLRDPNGCPSSYKFSATSGTATVVWDEDVENGTDMDGDGLGDALEVALGTCDNPNNPSKDTDGDGTKDCYDADVDNDGIQDGWEVLGIYDFNDQTAKDFCKKNVLNFPYYGADPKVQDIFTEVSWLAACFEPNPTVCGDRTAQKYKDALQWTVETAEAYVMGFAPDFRAHVDIGPVHDDHGTARPDTYDYGDWGARRLPDSITTVDDDPTYDHCGFSATDADTYHIGGTTFCQGFGNPVMDVANHKCKGTDSPRYGYFNHLVDNGPDGWGGMNAGLCSKTGRSGQIAVHETGHYFGLGHGGYESNSCKPNYMSIMSYCVDQGHFTGTKPGAKFTAFSHGWLLDSASGGEGTRKVVLNPTKLDERAGIGTSFPRNFDFLSELKLRFRKLVDTDPSSSTYGAVDWNDDGQIAGSGALLPAYLNCGSGTDYGSGLWGGPSEVSVGDAQDLPDYDTIAMYRSSGGEFGFLARYARWDGAANKTTLGQLIPTRRTGCTGDNCQDLVSYPGPQIDRRVRSMVVEGGLVAFQGDDGSLGLSGTVKVGVDASGMLRSAYSGAPSIVKAPMGSFSNGEAVMKVYAGSHINVLGGTPVSELRAQDISLSTGRPINGGWMSPQFFQNGDMVYIRDDSAIGVTRGYVRDDSGIANEVVVAAIPDWTSWTTTGQKPIVTLAILEQALDSTSGAVVDVWNRSIPSDPFANISIDRRAAGPGRVGLVYLPDDPADATVGRFYVTWQNPRYDDKGVFKNYAPLISVSRGNVIRSDSTCSAARSLCFPSFGDIAKDDVNWSDGLSLVNANGHVRGMLGAKHKGGDNRYFPHVDGVFYENQLDYNDYRHIQKNVGCSLTQCPTRLDFSY